MKYVYITLVALACLTSCEHEQPKVESGTPSNEISPIETKRHIQLNLTAKPDESSQLGQVMEEGTGKVLQPFSREKDLLVRLAIRSTNGVNYKTVVFKKEAGESKLTYREELSLPIDVNQVEVAAIVLREAGGNEHNTGTWQFAQTPSEEQDKKHLVQSLSTLSYLLPTNPEEHKLVVLSTIPYVADWSLIKIESNKEVHSDLRFKPSATLLHLRFENKQKIARKITGITVKTTAFVRDWVYDFTRLEADSSDDPNALMAGQRLNKSNSISEDTFDLSLPQEITLSPGELSPWYYYWCMPVKTNSAVSTEITVNAVDLKDPSQQDQVHTWHSSHHFQLGTTPIEVQINGDVSVPNGDEPSESTLDYSIDARRSQTWFMRGVNVSAPSHTTWKKIYNSPNGADMRGLRWEKEKQYGWYDLNKEDPTPKGGDSDLCWAAVAANTLQWWLDQNQEYVDLYDPDKKIPRSFETPFSSSIFNLYKSRFANKGGDLKTSFDWFFNGKYANPNGSASIVNWEGAGFFKEVFTKDLFTQEGRDKRFIGEDFRPVEQVGAFNEGFSDEIAKALRYGEGLSCVVKYPNGYLHALSIWGADFDDQGRVSHIYLTDSNDRDIDEPTNETQYTVRAGLVRKAIFYRSSYEVISRRTYAPGVYHESSAKGVFNFQIQTLCKLPLFQNEWRAYFKKIGKTT